MGGGDTIPINVFYICYLKCVTSHKGEQGAMTTCTGGTKLRLGTRHTSLKNGYMVRAC
jgi:hypothetical protein